MRLFIFAALVPIIAAPAAFAQTDLMGRVVACAGLEDEAKRHACFDVLTPELRGQGVKAFGETKKAATPAEPDQISLKVSAIDRAEDGMVFTMENGQVWKQSDTRQLGGFGKGPWTAEIRKGMLGSFALSVNGSASIKVKRVK